MGSWDLMQVGICRQLKADSSGGGDTNISIFHEDVYHNFTSFEFKEDWVVGEKKDDPRRKAGKQRSS